jgi:hypothetical protein
MDPSIINKVWMINVNPQTIYNCFKKAGFSKTDTLNEETENWEEVDLLPLSELNNVWASYTYITSYKHG